VAVTNSITSFVFQQVVSTTGLPRRLWSVARNALVAVLHDPSCTMKIHGHEMSINLSHALPIYTAHFPQYDKVLTRLGGFVRRRRHRLRVIDVGANIGDSIAAFMGDGDGVFLAVEPTPKFRTLLEANWGRDPRVQIVAAMCSSSDRVVGVSIGEHKGTAVLRESPQGTEVPVCTIDRLVRERGFSPVDVIKIDTDGFDFDVIEGARDTLCTDRPAVIFECDVFDNSSYVDRIRSTFSLFHEFGYRRALVYDNAGYIIGQVDIGNSSCFDSLLFYQVTSPFNYFDILMLPDEDCEAFYVTELDWFAGLAHGACQQAARSLITALRGAATGNRSPGRERLA
jgi:FkbM family methyltransferase